MVQSSRVVAIMKRLLELVLAPSTVGDQHIGSKLMFFFEGTRGFL